MIIKRLFFFIVAAFLVSCGPNGSQSITAPQSFTTAKLEMPQKWRVQCVGGSAQHSVPIFWDFKSYNSTSGRIEAYVTDADGYYNKFEDYGGATISVNPATLDEIAVFGAYVPVTDNFTKFQMKAEGCPGGMVGIRVS